MFLDRYKFHLLPIPLEDPLVGDICIYDGNDIKARSSITDFLENSYQFTELPPRHMPDISGTMSRAVSMDIGTGLLQNFLNAFGIGTVVQKIEVEFTNKGVRSLKFAFIDAIRHSINVVRVATDLMKSTFMISENHPLYTEGNRYYLVTAVARTSSLSIVTQDSTQRSIQLDINALQAINLSVKRSVGISSEGNLTFSSLRDSLAFGVELHELNYDLRTKSFKINAVRKFVGVRGASSKRDPAYIGDPIDGQVFLAGL